MDSKTTHKGEIIIVDDKPYLLEGLFDILEQEGYQVTTCKTAQEARKISQKINFKLALVDIKMPHEDGLELTKELKDYIPNLAVLILTAYPSQETAIKALKIGVVDYLVKPLNINELNNAIKKALEQRKEKLDIETIKSKLYHTQQELAQMKEALVRSGKFSSLGQVSMEVFHEIKNLLSVMNISIFYINKNIKNPEPKVKKHIDIVKKEIQHTNKLIISLLNFSRGKQDGDTEVNINKTLREILELLKPELSIKSVKLITSLSSNLNYIKGNIDKLKQVFLNLIINAKDAMPEGGELRISTYKENGYVIVKFSDTGKGIPQEVRGKIFTPFFSTKENNNGIGLGLTVSKEIVEEYDGRIDVNSTKKGTTFNLKFPVLNKGE